MFVVTVPDHTDKVQLHIIIKTIETTQVQTTITTDTIVIQTKDTTTVTINKITDTRTIAKHQTSNKTKKHKSTTMWALE